MLLFSNGGAKSKKRQSLRKKKVAAGRLMSPVDVRSPSDVMGLEQLLEKGPLTIVLIYADWCGACHRFKENTWLRNLFGKVFLVLKLKTIRYTFLLMPFD